MFLTQFPSVLFTQDPYIPSAWTLLLNLPLVLQTPAVDHWLYRRQLSTYGTTDASCRPLALQTSAVDSEPTVTSCQVVSPSSLSLSSNKVFSPQSPGVPAMFRGPHKARVNSHFGLLMLMLYVQRMCETCLLSLPPGIQV